MSNRVLYLHNSQLIGGAERALLTLATAIGQMDVEPLVVWPLVDDTAQWLRSRGVRVLQLKVPSWRHGLALPLIPTLLMRLRRAIRPGEIDLVHVNNYRLAPVGRFVARWAGVPCVCHVREMIASDKIRQYRLASSADFLIVVAEAVGQALVQGGLPSDRITVIRSGIALPETPTDRERAAVRNSLGVAAEDQLIGMVGHVLPHKGYDELIRAIALIREKAPASRCVIVGKILRESYLASLRQLARELSIEDRLVWAGVQQDVMPILHAIDLFVLPSRTEGLPITILEAMAAGRPVVATTVGGIPELVRHGETGLLVPPKDPQRLAEAMLALLHGQTSARAMGTAGRALVAASFTVEGEARETALLYQRILKVRRGPDSFTQTASGDHR
jgi:glycosyltransferase involved in cell wall biosynthesis